MQKALSIYPDIESNAKGFTLIELMVVMVIVGILAIGVVFMFADPTAKVKAAAFEMRGDFNLARSEAVRRNEDILIEFIDLAQEPCSEDNPTNCCGVEDPTKFSKCFSGGTQQGYVLCVDATPSSPITDPPSCSNEGTSSDDLEENIIKVVLFRNAIHYYTPVSGVLPTSSKFPTPSNSPEGVALVTDDGITFTSGEYFIYMNSNGTTSDTGSVLVYLPEEGDPTTLTVKGWPYAVVVDNISTGRVRLDRWRPEGASGEWFRK